MTLITTENKLEVAKLHLDRFWHEIFWRRENEQKVTVWTIGSFAAVIALVYGKEQALTKPQKVIFAALPIILGVLAAWYLYENSRKNKELARLIVRLNKALGAWESGSLVEGPDPLYPDKWKDWGAPSSHFYHDRVSFFYFLLVLAAMSVCAVSIFLK